MTQGGMEAGERLALTLAGSLLLHFALIFGLQVHAPVALPVTPYLIQARLVEAEQPEAAMSPKPESLHLDAQPALPPDPVVTRPDPSPPSSATPMESASRLPAIEMPLIEDPNYYVAQQVDVHPVAVKPIQPDYPEEAVKAGVTGSVVLVLLLDEGGKVREISVEEATPPGYFEASAQEAFRQARFSPAQRGGRVVKSRMRIKVNYELANAVEPVDRAN